MKSNLKQNQFEIILIIYYLKFIDITVDSDDYDDVTISDDILVKPYHY